MRKTAYFDCPTGLAGDMVLAALIDCGAEQKKIEADLQSLPLPKWQMTVETVLKNGLRACSLHFLCPEEHQHRYLSDIEQILRGGHLTPSALNFALRVFRALAEAEAEAHGCAVEQICFHEVGALDSILDIAGAAVALDLLGIDRVYCSSLPLFSGTVMSAHGQLALPAPAVARLLQGMKLRPTDFRCELITPTGAAILRCLLADDGFNPPELILGRCGLGAGDRDLPLSNVLRIFLAETTQTDGEIEVISTALDDCPPELLGGLWQKAFALGALDLQMAPVYMKKGRPATAVTLLAKVGEGAKLAQLMFTETTSLGVRIHRERRLVRERHTESVPTKYGDIILKVAGENIAPEYEACAEAAVRCDVAVKLVYQEAIAAYLRDKE